MDLLSLDLVIVITIIIFTDCSGMSYEGESTTQKSPTSTLLQMTTFLGTNVSEIGTTPVWNTTDNSGPQRIKQKLSRLLKRKYRKNCYNAKQQQSVECKKLVLKIQEVMNSSGQAIMKLLDIKPKPDGAHAHVSDMHANRTIKVSTTLQRVFEEECNFTSEITSDICTWLLGSITQMLNKENTNASSKANELRQHLKTALCLDYNPATLKWYDKDELICCNGLFNRTSPHDECCRDNIIDNSEQFCCNDHAYSYTVSAHDFNGCCGKKPYSDVDGLCCDNIVNSIGRNQTACCGKGTFNPDEELCCSNITMVKESNKSACCGSRMYDQQSQACCDGNVKPAFGERNENGVCCGSRNYESKCYSCEKNGEAHEAKEKFNTSSHICCNGRVKKRKGYLSKCCGVEIIDAELYECTNGNKILRNYTSTGPVNVTSSNAYVVVNSSTTVVDYQFTAGIGIEDEYLRKQHITKTLPLTIKIVIGGSACLAVALVGLFYKFFGGHFNNFIKVYVCGYKGTANAHEGNECNCSLLSGQCVETNETKQFLANNTVCSKSYMDQKSVSSFPVALELSENTLENTSELESETDFNFKESSYYQKGSNDVNVSSDKNTAKPVNLVSNHFVDCSTQTGSKKDTNQRTIFGEPFEHTFMLSESKATIELSDSVEKMTLPRIALTDGPVEVHRTSFSSLTQLHRKFNLSDNVKIASPAAEYSVTGLQTLQDYACVTKRFIGSKADLKVWKFHSDEGMRETIYSIPVPEKTNEAQEVYFEVKGNVVYIYTKSFSGFYCTTCYHRELKLKAFLFGSYKRFQPNRHEVRLMMYVADEVFKIPDYRRLMIEKEEREGRVLKTEVDVEILEDLHEEDKLMASVTVDGNTEQWIHKLHPTRRTPIKPVNKDIALKLIANKCTNGCSNCHLRETDVPYCMEWYLTNAPDIIPEQTFKCVIDVTCIKKSSIDCVAAANGDDLGHENGATCIILDELHLRPEDRLPLEEREDTIHSLIDYFTHAVGTDNKAKIINELVTKHNLCGNSTVREVFTNLQKNLTSTGIYEAVVCVLQKNNFYVELDHLKSKNIIPSAFFPKPSQRVESGGHELAQRDYEHHQQVSNNNSMAAQALHTSAIVLNRSTPLNTNLVLTSGYNGNTANVALPRSSNDNADSTQMTRQLHDLHLSTPCSDKSNNVKDVAMGGRSVSESQLCRPEVSGYRATSFSLNGPIDIETGDLGIPSNPHPEISQPHIESVQSNRVNVRAPSNVRPELSTTNSDSIQERVLAMPRYYPTQENASIENTLIKEINSDTDSDVDV